MATIDIFDIRPTLFAKRNNQPIGGGNPHRFIELVGGQEVLMQSHEPDPNTAREQFYYNTRMNALFRRVDTVNRKGNPTSIWKLISEC